VGDLTLRIYEDPYNADEVQNEYSAMLLARAPWIPAAERSRPRWSAEGRTIELEAWLRRLIDADASSRIETDGIISAIEEVRPRAEVRRSIEALEKRQREREGVLNDLLTILEKSGWLIDSATRGNLAQRFDAAGELQRMDTKARDVLKVIKRDIEPWRPKSAANLLEQLMMIKSAPEHDLLARIEVVSESEVAAITVHRTVVDREIGEWLESGVILPQERDAKANFREHELNSERWRADVSAAAEASERILQHQADSATELQFEGTLWHAENAVLLVAAAARFDREVELIEISVVEKFDQWKKYGIEIEELLERLNSQPRWVANQVERIDPKVEEVIKLLRQIIQIDSSVIEDDRLETWTRKLRRLPDEEELGELNTSLNRLMIRQQRHRESLDSARQELRSGWPNGLDSTNMTLQEYEEAILTLESGKRFEVQESSIDVIGQYEIERWAAAGWDVSGLRQKSAEDPPGLAKNLPLYREAIEARPDLIRLLLPLPWGRDLKLTSEVEASLRRPDDLLGLESRRRSIAIHLASLRPAADRPLLVFQPTPDVFKELENVPIYDAESNETGLVFTTKSPEEAENKVVENAGEGDLIARSIINSAAQYDRLELPTESNDEHLDFTTADVKISGDDQQTNSDAKFADERDENKTNLTPEYGVSEGERGGGLESEFLEDNLESEKHIVSGVESNLNEVEIKESEKPQPITPKYIKIPLVKSNLINDSSGKKEDDFEENTSDLNVTSLIELVDIDTAENDENELLLLDKINQPTESIKENNPPSLEVTAREELIDWVGENNGDPKDIGVEQLLDQLGISDNELNRLGEIAAAAPRDIRVQRLVRLIAVVNSINDDDLKVDLLESLIIGARVLDDWTALRLMNRRAKSGDGLLADSARLVGRLSDVPGPGIPLPTGLDETPLPTAKGVDLIRAVAIWRAAVELPHAGALDAGSA
jgi:predicted translin family RNA/ssDNA-binding protein